MANLDLAGLLLAISQRLEPIRASLVEYGIPISMTPAQAGVYRIEAPSKGFIEIILPGGKFEEVMPGEMISIEGYRDIFISMRFPYLYANTSQQEIYEQAGLILLVKIVERLIGWQPPVAGITGEIVGNDGDNLYPPQGDLWVHEVRLKVPCSWQASNLDDKEDYGKIKEIITKYESNIFTSVSDSEMIQE